MRTTIRIDDRLLAKTRQLAAETGRTLTALIEDALREMLARRKSQHKRTAVRLTTFRGKGVMKGIDLDDSAGLLELMEEKDAAR